MRRLLFGKIVFFPKMKFKKTLILENLLSKSFFDLKMNRMSFSNFFFGKELSVLRVEMANFEPIDILKR